MEAREDWRQLAFDIADVQVLRIQQMLAPVAVPEKSVLFPGLALTLDNETH